MADFQPLLPKEYTENLAAWQRRFAEVRKPAKLEELLPGEDNANRREKLRTKGYYIERGVRYGAYISQDGYVLATAAAVPRNPGPSIDRLSEVADFQELNSGNRADRIDLYYRIYRGEPMANNAVNRAASLISTDGSFYISRARQGKRSRNTVKEELTTALNWWARNVNARGIDGPVTGARGLTQIMEQGNRQALIEGTYIGYIYDRSVTIPSLGKTFTLPMFVQSISTKFIEIPDGLPAGLELFYWKPDRKTLRDILNPKDPNVKKLIQESLPSEVINQLRADGKVLLERDRIIHIKHRGVDFDPYGESLIEPAVSPIAYKRALQALEFVSIDSLVNRVIIIKVGSDNPGSQYHNLESVNMRMKALENTLGGEVGPNMMVLWAGPDIDVVEVSAHNSLLDVKDRFDLAHEMMRLAFGTPKPILDGTDAGSQVWAGYEGYREGLRGMQNNWSTVLSALGERIARNNGYDDVDVVYTPNRSLLADQTAGANLALNARRAGAMSLRRLVKELGGDFEAERRNRLIEMGYDPDSPADQLPTDDEIFSPPFGMPGDTRIRPDGSIRRPGAPPGRPTNEERQSTEPERAPYNRNPRDGE